MYLIKRTDQGGGFLADISLTNGASFTRDIRKARTFYSRESAQRECCPENERPVALESLLTSPEG